MASTNRKFGRNKRGASNKYYTSSHKWEVNKKRKMAKHARAVAIQRAKSFPRVARGTARALRREHLQGSV